jgi:hypothetical protein
MAKIELVCPTRGAADMVRDAAARWNAETQEWERSSIYDVMTCDSCGEETYECGEVDLDTLPNEDSHDWIVLANAAEKTPNDKRTLTQKYLIWKAHEEGYDLSDEAVELEDCE